MPKFEIMTLKSDSISDKIQLQGWFQTPTAHATLSHICLQWSFLLKYDSIKPALCLVNQLIFY